MSLDRPRELEAQLLHPARHVEGPRAVAEVALDLADDRWHGVRRELHATIDVEALDREHEADGADLDEILERLAPPGVARRDLADERQVLLDESVSRRLVARAVCAELLEDVGLGGHCRHSPFDGPAETPSSTQ